MANKNNRNIGRWVAFCTLAGAVACSSGSQNDPDNSQQGNNANNQTPAAATAVIAAGWDSIDMIADLSETKMDTLGHYSTSYNACMQSAFGTADLNLWNQMANQLNQAIMSSSVTTENEICFDNPQGYQVDSVDVALDASTAPGPIPSPAVGAPQFVADEVVQPRFSPIPLPWPFPQPSSSHTPDPRPFPSGSVTPISSPTPHPSASASPSPSPSPSTPTRRLYEMSGGQMCTTIEDPQLAQALLQSLSQLADEAHTAECSPSTPN